MIAFIIAALCGYATPRLDEPVAQPVMKLVSPILDIPASETRLVSFMLAALIAAILAAIFGHVSAFAVVAGVILGYFAESLIGAVRKK